MLPKFIDLLEGKGMLEEFKALRLIFRFQTPTTHIGPSVFIFFNAAFDLSRLCSHGYTGVVTSLRFRSNDTSDNIFPVIDRCSDNELGASYSSYGTKIPPCTAEDDFEMYEKNFSQHRFQV